MRLERVQLRGFLSHTDTDWSPDGARLVSLVGPNGAGKSSLASDALLYALFDDARARTDDLVQTGSSEMSVLVEFGYGGARYRVTRGRTRRAGGKSYLELAVAEGDGWRPLTADDIRTTQARIAELLRMDADTFETAALLVQGRANRFAEATAAERKRVLGAVLGLDVFERAEARARELSRDLDRDTAAARAEIERLDGQLADRREHEDAVEEHTRQLATLEAEAAAVTAKRTAAEDGLRDLAGELAAVEAAMADVARLEAELDDHKARWRRADARRIAALATAERASATLAQADDVADAGGRLEAARAAVDAGERAEARQRVLAEGLEAARERLRAAIEPHQAAVADLEGRRSVLADRVTELEAVIARLRPVNCPKCGERFAADPADLAGHLEDARQELNDLGDPPAEPMAVARERSQVVRRESDLREHSFGVAELTALAAARRELVGLERVAAQAERIADARTALGEAEAAAAAALAEQEAVTAAGTAARAALKGAREKADAGSGLAQRKARLEVALDGAAEALRYIEGARARANESLGSARRRLEELDGLAERRDGLAASAAAGVVELGRHQRLVVAFGVKGIPARVIEGVLPELARYANELLGELRPGMALELRAQRAKKGGDGVVEALDLVVRDDVGERPLSLFSGGERMSVSLALAVGLSRLVARRAGTAIRTLVIDEPDGLDAEARRNFGQALRVLAHHGELERVVLVSHHQDLADVGDAVYQVSKNGKGSLVEQVA